MDGRKSNGTDGVCVDHKAAKTALLAAARSGDVEVVRKLVMHAVASGEVAEAEKLLTPTRSSENELDDGNGESQKNAEDDQEGSTEAEDQEANAQGEDYWFHVGDVDIFSEAASHNQIGVLLLLFSREMTERMPYVSLYGLENAIWRAVSDGATESMDQLLGSELYSRHQAEVGCDVNELLESAVDNHEPAMIRVLLAHGANPNYRSDRMWQAIAGEESDGCLSVLLDAGMDVTAASRNDYEKTVLCTVAAQSLTWNRDMTVTGVSTSRLLLAHGADVNVHGDEQWTPLHSACLLGKWALVALLLEHGADVEAREQYQNTPLLIACDCRNGYNREVGDAFTQAEVVKALLPYHPDLNVTTQNRRSPVFIANYEAFEDVEKLLIAAGAKCQCPSTYRDTSDRFNAWNY